MGQSAFLTPPTSPKKQKPHSLRLGFDVPMLIVVVCLLVFGLLMVYSASWKFSVTILEQSPNYIILRQLMWAALGIVLAVAASLVNYQIYQKIALPLLLLTLGLLLAVLFVNRSSESGRTLINNSAQPSELAKLVIIIYLSVWLNSKQDVLNNMSFGLVPMVFILAIMGAFIMLQTDISATFTVLLLGGLLFFLAKGDLRQIALVIFLACCMIYMVVNFTSRGQDRIEKFKNGLLDPQKADYQIKASFSAIVDGGLTGVGIGKGVIKNINLPVAWTDSIFAVIIEETGLIGGFFVLAMYMIFLWRGLRIAARAPDNLGRLLAGGITIWIVTEAIINIGVMVSLLPVAGNALPLISFGGSSLVVTMVGIGILMNIARSGQDQESTQERSSFSAFVNLRWRDRRRRVSRARRSASTGQ
jgi:cell division protein FtsW